MSISRKSTVFFQGAKLFNSLNDDIITELCLISQVVLQTQKFFLLYQILNDLESEHAYIIVIYSIRPGLFKLTPVI